MRYTKEQIKKTLRLFEETQSVTETIRKLGYPTREYFYTWKKKRAQYETFPDIPRERKKSLIIKLPKDPCIHPVRLNFPYTNGILNKERKSRMSREKQVIHEPSSIHGTESTASWEYPD